MQVGELSFAWRRPSKNYIFTTHVRLLCINSEFVLICSMGREAEKTLSGIFVV